MLYVIDIDIDFIYFDKYTHNIHNYRMQIVKETLECQQRTEKSGPPVNDISKRVNSDNERRI